MDELEVDQDNLQTGTAIGSHASHEHELRFLVHNSNIANKRKPGPVKGKDKGKGQYLLVLLTDAQKCFTISEVAADWHELMIPQRTMRPSIVP